MSSSSRPPSRNSKRARPSTPIQARNPVRDELRSIQEETESILPAILKRIRRRTDASKFEKFTLDDLPRLSPNDCPSFPKPATIRVINKDTFDAAIEMMKTQKSSAPGADESSAASSLDTPEPESRTTRKPPAVVNFANRHEPGGGWLNGAMAQEEALFYRSSLSLSLKKDIVMYPLKTLEAVYSPHVFVIRSSHADGHELLVKASPGVYHNGQKVQSPTVKIDDQLPEVSVLTVAAINGPEVDCILVKSRLRETRAYMLSLEPAKPDTSVRGDEDHDSKMSGTPEAESESTAGASESPEPQETAPEQRPKPLPGLPPSKQMFKYNRERNLTKDKMRMVLRMAAIKGHTSIVLGALGCGAFGNPPEDVANCWLEVLREDEFSGNWWGEVVFAVLDSGESQDGNYHVFRNILDGKEV